MSNEDRQPAEATDGTGGEESGAAFFAIIRPVSSVERSLPSRITGPRPDEISWPEEFETQMPSTDSEHSAPSATTDTVRAEQRASWSVYEHGWKHVTDLPERRWEPWPDVD